MRYIMFWWLSMARMWQYAFYKPVYRKEEPQEWGTDIEAREVVPQRIALVLLALCIYIGASFLSNPGLILGLGWMAIALGYVVANNCGSYFVDNLAMNFLPNAVAGLVIGAAAATAYSQVLFALGF